MRGRSKITFSEKTKRLLKGMEDEDADLVTKATWLGTAAGRHTRFANKLINVARRMKTKASNDQKASGNQTLIINTIEAYKELAAKLSKKEELAHAQEDHIKDSCMPKSSKQKNKKTRTKEQEEAEVNNKIDEVQTFGAEVKAALEQIEACNINNVIHAIKIARYGETHKRLAQSYIAKAKGKVEKATKARNSSNEDGGKHLVAAIGEQMGKPLTNVCGDQDTCDGGKRDR